MNAKRLNSEKGQAIVYLALGMVVFLGFVAMAIDGGMALADRRQEQNAADAASLAGGSKAAIDLDQAKITTQNWSCGSAQFAMNNGEYFAIQRALANNFTITDPYPSPCDHNCVIATCSNADKYVDVTVEISATTQSNFLQLVFPTALHNEVAAVTRVYPGGPLVNGNAIVALNSAGCQGHQDGGIMYGSGLVDVHGGGIWSNGCMRGNGKPNVTVDPPYGIYGNELSEGHALWSPSPTLVHELIPPELYKIKLPDCNDPDAHNVSSLPANMDPGLWCITGDLQINAQDTIIGDGVTIYLATGGISINGGATIKITSPDPDAKPKDVSPAIPGVLIYLPSTNHSVVSLNGNSDTRYTGTILAPGAEVTINGTNGTDAYHSQIIGWDVLVGGTADTYVTYLGDENAGLPTSMELHK
jgi:hypothetical protein